MRDNYASDILLCENLLDVFEGSRCFDVCFSYREIFMRQILDTTANFSKKNHVGLVYLHGRKRGEMANINKNMIPKPPLPFLTLMVWHR